MISKKILILGSAVLVSAIMAGCNTVETAKQDGSSHSMPGQISEEEFAKAFDAYIAKNQIAFGGKVMDSVTAFQTEQQKSKTVEKQSKIKDLLPKVSATEHVTGSANPEFVLFEYSDFHCPYCQKFHPTAKEFVTKNTNVQWVFRPLPFKGTPLHEVSECVSKVAGNDAFWKFSEAVFADTSITPENYKDALARLNIQGADTIDACFKSGEMKAPMEKAVTDGVALGIEGTPNSILQNVKTGEIRIIEGAYPLAELEKAMADLKK